MIDEILVHISTPATRQNDHLYRSLADAYLDFEPHNGEREQGIPLLSRPQNEAAATETGEQNMTAGSSILSTSIESYGSFPSYISSVEQPGGSRNVEVRHDAASTNDGSVPTNNRLARLDHLHQHWMKQTTPKSSFVNAQQYPSRPLPTLEHAETDFIEDTQLGAQALQSQLQDSYSSTSEDTSDDEDEPNDLPPEVPSADHHQPPTNTVPVETPSITNSRPHAAAATSSPEQPGLTRSKNTRTSFSRVTEPPSKKRKTEKDNCSIVTSYNFSDLPLDVFPPAPKISIECPGKLPSQITKYLAVIKAQNHQRFKPSKRHGNPEMDDRGYWLINCSKWVARVQLEFWASLSEHVSSGKFGWGVTLHRDASNDQTLGRVRLYCWAEVVEHTWLLLWLCSKGEVVGSGCKWMDADGSVAFEME
jgi:hypothetical protein